MIAGYTTQTPFPYDRRHRTQCPNCGCYHDCPETAATTVLYIAPEPTPILKPSLIRYEAVGKSREMAKGRLPDRFLVSQVREPPLWHVVHRLRCPCRRPAMSLMQRIRQEKRKCRQKRTG